MIPFLNRTIILVDSLMHLLASWIQDNKTRPGKPNIAAAGSAEAKPRPWGRLAMVGHGWAQHTCSTAQPRAKAEGPGAAPKRTSAGPSWGFWQPFLIPRSPQRRAQHHPATPCQSWPGAPVAKPPGGAGGGRWREGLQRKAVTGWSC